MDLSIWFAVKIAQISTIQKHWQHRWVLSPASAVLYVDLNDYLNHFKGDLYGLDLEGKPLDTFKNPNKCGFILGNESHGISPAIQPLLKDRLTIKKYGSAESLNVAMTANILLYQLRSFV